MATIDDLTAQIRAFEHGPPWRRIAAVRDRVLVTPIPRYAADVVAVAGLQGADVVLCEGVPGIVVGALATGCPVAVLMPNIYLRPTAGRPPMGTGWSPGRHRLFQLRNTLAGKAYTRIIDTCVPAVNRAAAAYGVPPVAHTMDLYDRCARVLVMTSRSFDFAPDGLPGNVRYTGPQLEDPDWAAPDPQPQLDLLPPGSDPLVLVAMSSIFQNQTAVLRRAAAALGGLPVRGLVTTGWAVDPGQLRVPANVRAVRAAPHSALLPLAAAVITHAGHGTVLKALAAAVPLVCMPQGRDQKDNTARVLRLGAGVRVKPGSAPRPSPQPFGRCGRTRSTAPPQRPPRTNWPRMRPGRRAPRTKPRRFSCRLAEPDPQPPQPTTHHPPTVMTIGSPAATTANPRSPPTRPRGTRQPRSLWPASGRSPLGVPVFAGPPAASGNTGGEASSGIDPPPGLALRRGSAPRPAAAVRLHPVLNA